MYGNVHTRGDDVFPMPTNDMAVLKEYGRLNWSIPADWNITVRSTDVLIP